MPWSQCSGLQKRLRRLAWRKHVSTFQRGGDWSSGNNRGSSRWSGRGGRCKAWGHEASKKAQTRPPGPCMQPGKRGPVLAGPGRASRQDRPVPEDRANFGLCSRVDPSGKRGDNRTQTKGGGGGGTRWLREAMNSWAGLQGAGI